MHNIDTEGQWNTRKECVKQPAKGFKAGGNGRKLSLEEPLSRNTDTRDWRACKFITVSRIGSLYLRSRPLVPLPCNHPTVFVEDASDTDFSSAPRSHNQRGLRAFQTSQQREFGLFPCYHVYSQATLIRHPDTDRALSRHPSPPRCHRSRNLRTEGYPVTSSISIMLPCHSKRKCEMLYDIISPSNTPLHRTPPRETHPLLPHPRENPLKLLPLCRYKRHETTSRRQEG